ncbi:MAG: hypothetical protein JWO82_3574 [Akkermansiaceae bacterium]|nr:hypothetical protein [Akkermansiaceae bacterium]
MNQIPQTMNKLIGILTLGIAALAATSVAEARPHHGRGGYGGGHDRGGYEGRGGYGGGGGCSRRYVEYSRSCGGPAYIETYVAYYNDCGDPVYRTRVIPVVVRVARPCPPPVYCPPRGYDRGPRFTVQFNGGWR